MKIDKTERQHSYWLRSVPNDPDMAQNTVTLTQEQFDQLLQRIGSVNVQNGNFTGCPTRFNGSKDSDVNAFIDAVETYKECTQVSDVNALRGLSMLLDDFAATWWQGVKDTITDWTNAVTLLRTTFGPKKPAYKIYRELFSKEQDLKISSDIFICQARSILSQLPANTLVEAVQIDMVYGLLHRRIRERVARDKITTFSDLLKECRLAEETFVDRFEEKPPDGTKRVKCAYCKFYGHSKDECHKLSKSKGTSQSSVAANTELKPVATTPPVQCFGCGKPGFVRSNCPVCKTASTSSVDFCALEKSVNTISPKPRPILKINVLDSIGTGIVDTAAKQSVASISLCKLLKAKGQVFSTENTCLKLADGSVKNEVVLVTTVDVVLQELRIPTTFICLPNADVTLLGIDFLTDAGLILDISGKFWYFADKPNNVFTLDFEKANTPIVEVHALNLLRPDEGIMLSDEEKSRLSALLKSNQDVFALGGEPTPFAEHRIDTGSHAPISVPPYRMTPAKKEILKRELDKLLEANIIEECESPWSAPVVLVPKKDGGTRLCVDYRALNSITKMDSYPLPRMDDLIHATKRTFYMTTMDLRSGYHQVRVRDADKDKTAFVTPFGTFRYLAMPFGLCGAPASFQRLIDRFRSGLSDVLVLAYLDDLIILSESYEIHLRDLQMVFNRLRLFKLRANREKCTFASEKVRYLGHIITSEGILVDPDKTAAIERIPPPRNVKNIQSFLQTCSWYRRFIDKFADISRPLSNLTKKNAVWEWGPAQQEAFEKLKVALTSAPILQQNDGTKPYILRTDASSYALGAVLLQGDGPDEHPIEYASRLLTPPERNYSTTEKEALAVVWSLDKFKGYLDTSSVIVTTDHQPLKWLLSLKSPTGRLARWALIIQSYNLKIDYIPGKRNVVADMLSRPPCNHEDTVTCDVCLVTIEIPHRSSSDIRAEQLKDADLQKIINSFENHLDDEISRWTARGYLMTNGVLYKYSDTEDQEEAQLVVPAHERARVLSELHDAPTAAHYGVERTVQRIAKQYYFPGMRRFVAEYVKNCAECLRYKATNQKPAGLLQTPIYAQRFEVLAIDLFGPLPISDTGHQWIYIIEDTASKWIELFPLVKASAEECAKVLIDEIFLRYGLPRRIISDNGVQFVSTIMQKVCHCLGIKQNLTPLYHPQANMVERKNRDLKPRLAILVGNKHTSWPNKLPSIRFAMNSAKGETTGHTPAYLTFAREMRTPDEVNHDLRTVVQSENFIPQITPYLDRIALTLRETKAINEKCQDRQKQYADEHRRPAPNYQVGDRVLVTTHTRSSQLQGITTKFNPKRDGPYVIIREVSPTSFQLANPNSPEEPLGTYHSSLLTPYSGEDAAQPVIPLRKRGRPKKKKKSTHRSGSSSGRLSKPEGEHVTPRSSRRPEPATSSGH